MTRGIKIDSADGYLHMNDLPHDCIFNKVLTGCGGTTVALRNSEDYVIAVPTTELIINKTGRTNAGLSMLDFGDKEQSIFGLFGRFDEVRNELVNYLQSDGTKKIMCTYDKVSGLLDYLEPRNYRLLIDEYHGLLKAYSYRQKAINGVLDNYRRFKSFCFMSATPILPDFKPHQLADVKQIEAEWDEKYLNKLKVDLHETNKPYSLTANIINTYKRDGFIISENGIKSYEAFFFINSVTDIVAILRHCNLTNDEVRIICADNDDNREKLIGYDISNSRSPNKMFNFITSKSFEGADYHSDSGLCFVISSASNPHTQASIDTDIPQIAGRIRTKSNPFRNYIVHIFNTTYKKLNLDITYDQMKAQTDEAIQTAHETVKMFNDTKNKKVKDFLRDHIKHDLNSLYMKYDKEKDQFILNDLLPKLELYNFKVNEVVYKSGLSIKRNYEDNGIEITTHEFQKIKQKLTYSTKKPSFKQLFIKYTDLVTKHPFSLTITTMEKSEPLLREAYMKLGVEKVKSLRYTKKNIQDALISIDKTTDAEQKIARIIVKNISTGESIRVADANKIIKDAYTKVGIKHLAKAKDLHKWFECSDPISKRIDGKVIKCVDIYRAKIIFKDETNDKPQNK